MKCKAVENDFIFFPQETTYTIWHWHILLIDILDDTDPTKFGVTPLGTIYSIVSHFCSAEG